MSSLSLPSWALLLSALLLPILARYLAPSRRLSYPPGPPPSVIVGNALQIPADHPEYKFLQWASIYGSIFHLQVFSQPMVVLNTMQAAQDLLEKRGAIYSDRPRFVLFSELMGWKNATTHVRYGTRFRKHRRFIHQSFNQRAALGLASVQCKEAATLIEGLTTTPQAFFDHIRRYAAATILKIAYGADVQSIDDQFVRLAERAGTLTVQSGSPAASLVDYFPVMRHIPTWAPFSGFKRDVAEVKAAVDLMMNVPYEKVKEQMLAGRTVPSFTSRLIEEYRGSNSLSADTEADIKGAAGTLYAAAEDTTACVIESFILAMILNPEVQLKAQQELDSVIGAGKVATLGDRTRLPYIAGLVKEVYRWNPPVPLGMPHRVMEDDVYCDYFIPCGSTILANIYAILQDCQDAGSFKPERYTDDPNMIDPREVVFGFGRRKCPGRHFADNGVWIAIISMLSSVTVLGARDSQGSLVHPQVEFEAGFVRHPKKFTCKIVSRY